MSELKPDNSSYNKTSIEITNAPYDKEFIFHDGRRAKNIIELYEIMKSLSDNEFTTFVNSTKNDFANWIELVLLDKELADGFRKTNSKDETIILCKKKVEEITRTGFNDTNYTKIKELAVVNQNDGSYIRKEKKEDIKVSDETEAHKLKESEKKKKFHLFNNTKHFKNKWFKFVKEDLFKKKKYENDEKIVEEEPTGKNRERGNKKEIHTKSKDELEEKIKTTVDDDYIEDYSIEDIIWKIVYGLIIILIIGLLIYKFFYG